MAFGFTPSYTENINTENIPETDLLILALDVADKMNLNVIYKSASGFIAATTNGIFKFNCRITCTITEDTVNIKSESTGNEMYDMGRNKKKVKEYEAFFFPLVTNYNPEMIHSRYETIKSELPVEEQDQILHPDKSSFLSLLFPSPGYFITPLLVDINILIFVLMAFTGVSILSPTNSDLLNWGANFGPLTLDGQWWRIITNCFLHVGIMHLLLNMYALIYIGIMLEPYLGRLRYSAAYLLTGIAGSICSLCLHSFTVSAGASGAIFGLYGVFLAMLSTNLIEKKARKPLLISIGIFVILNLTNGMKAGIDNAAHIGGLISGLIIGYSYVYSLKHPEKVNLKYIITSSVSVFIVTIAIITYNRIPNDLAIYQKKMQIFSKNEKKADRLLHSVTSVGNGDLLDSIRNAIADKWMQNLNILEQNKKLNLPPSLHHKDLIFAKYYNIRFASLNLIYKGIKEKTEQYNDSLKYYNNALEETVKDLKE